MRLLILISLLICVFAGTLGETNKIVCYYGSWSVYRHGNGKFDVENIDPTLCTHLIYTFVGLGDNGNIRVLDPYNDLEENWGKGAFKRFVALKNRNPEVKTMVAIGGWNEGSVKYSNMVGDDKMRANFVKNAAEFVQKYGFDGLDLDWEYPNQRGGEETDVENHAKLVRELRNEFDKHGLILTAAVAAAEFSMSKSYNIPEISKYLDFINVMTYDLHGAWDKAVGHNTPLYPSSKDVTDLQKQLNVRACIEEWIKRGADPSKLVMGLASYGRTFTLQDPNQTSLGSPITGGGNPGQYTSESGFVGYMEIIELLSDGTWTVERDPEQMVPHMYKGNQWVGYDDPESITLKVQFAKKMKLGGCMVWSVETDDFNGLSSAPFPILRTINDVLGREYPTPEPTSSTTRGPTTTSVPTIPPSSLCSEPDSYVRDPVDCGEFYYCTLVNGKWVTYTFHCPLGLQFDLNTNSCNYPSIVNCHGN